ncbi:MAG: CpsB/CapC family capsule biosynthesis tyrosine phosphatase [Odoribacter sp.]|nr:CpsB/CapC family capsule biosynthesis tyrosine phosphatase [Odoribacter sp.]
MWFFPKRRSLRESGIFQGFTEWHCHLLPGVDDGIKTLDESLKTLRLYEEAGIRTVWLTPHIMEDIPNTPAQLRERFGELQQAYKGSIELHLAAEHMLDALFEERLEADDLLPIGEEGNHLLVETSYFNPPMDLKGMLKRIQAKGYHPLLAHPERYVYMDERDYHELKDLDIKFQLNIPALVGMYGERVQKKAQQLLKAGMYTCMGNDTHTYRFFASLLDAKLPEKELEKLSEMK